MAKCIVCGKHGLFFLVNDNGICPECEEKRQELRKQYLKECEEQAQSELAAIDNLPKCNIELSDQKIKIQSTDFFEDLKYTNITPKSKKEKFSKFIVLDIETTGLSAAKNDVIEIAAIKYKNFEPVETFHTFVAPKKGLKAEAQDINGITDEMVEDAPLLYHVIPSLQNFIADYDLLAHNFEFDFKFLCRAGLDIMTEKRKFYDTMQIAQNVLKKPKSKYDKDLEEYAIDYMSDYDVENYKLETLCNYYKILRLDVHRGLGDCFDTARLFLKLMDEIID